MSRQIPAATSPDTYWLKVEVSSQLLNLMSDQTSLWQVPVSTSRFGVGEVEGSHQTPRGWHQIFFIFGHNMPMGTQFVCREPNGFIWNPQTPDHPEDMILSRIFWLDGVEAHNANSKQRFIYIHGTNQEDEIGTPASFGCVRMRNTEVCRLCSYAKIGTRVLIVE
jgi:L,D-transpeptidase YbiS